MSSSLNLLVRLRSLFDEMSSQYIPQCPHAYHLGEIDPVKYITRMVSPVPGIDGEIDRVKEDKEYMLRGTNDIGK